jgi:hypothetical protein
MNRAAQSGKERHLLNRICAKHEQLEARELENWDVILEKLETSKLVKLWELSSWLTADNHCFKKES